MKKFIWILITIILLVALLAWLASIYLASNLRPLIEKAIGDSLNTKVKIEVVSFDRQNKTIKLKGMSVYSPRGFDENEVLAEIPELTVNYDPHNLFKDKKLHLAKLTLYIKTLTVVKRQDGKLNVELLNISDTDMNLMPIWTDEVIVTLDNLLYKELKKQGSPHVEMFEVKIKDKKYQDLGSIDHIAMNIVLDALGKTTVKGTMLYASATLLGASTGGAGLITAAILPKGNSSKAEFQDSFDDVYNAAYKTISDITNSFKENKKSGIISTNLDHTAVTIKIIRLPSGKTQVLISASMFRVAKPRTAKAILYAISQKLSK